MSFELYVLNLLSKPFLAVVKFMFFAFFLSFIQVVHIVNLVHTNNLQIQCTMYM